MIVIYFNKTELGFKKISVFLVKKFMNFGNLHLKPLALKVNLTPASAFLTVTSRHRTTRVGRGTNDGHSSGVVNSCVRQYNLLALFLFSFNTKWKYKKIINSVLPNKSTHRLWPFFGQNCFFLLFFWSITDED